MITRQEGEDLIECMVPHTGTPGDAHPITASHYHITHDNVVWLGIDAERFEGLPGYDGPETHGNRLVHVFDLQVFKDYVSQLTLIPAVKVHIVDMPGRAKEREI